MPASHSISRYKPQRHAQPRMPLAFSDWCNENSAGLILPLELNADIVAWINAVMQTGGDKRGIENISTLERVLKHCATPLRFPTEAEFEKALLTARVLFRAYESGVVS
jgi:hypothetical protein